ncbi:geranylgeranyl reductase family protein [Rugosimonospora acidiphila]|uniref:Geranylgeranyl reductase family protein n=1 Tax=Rugosimonospora acidiphila TaxID=556531 RepID=A0ABP9SNP9_9ACTN
MDEYDVVIVGAGPAGSSAAIAARRAGASVLLLDRADFPRDKTCGDGIASHTLEVLRDLGVDGVHEGYAPVPALSFVAPSGAAVARRMARPNYTIPRTVFDARLVEAAVAAGAKLCRHTVRDIDHRPGSVVLDGVISARTVIGADGAYSRVRRALGQPANPPGRVALAIRGYAPALAAGQQYIVAAPATQWPAYAWSFPIGDGLANIGYGEVLHGPALSREHLLDRLAALLPQVDIAGATQLRAHHLPLSTYRPVPGQGRLLLAGDAYSLINPFTGEGIFYAVLSGSLAGAAAARGVGQGRAAAALYRATLRRRLGRHLRHSRLAAALTGRARVVDAAIRAAGRDQRVFQSIAELGLGDGLLSARTLAGIARALR